MRSPAAPYAAAVARRPAVALTVLLVVILALTAGITRAADQAGTDGFLPADGDVATAQETIAEVFPDSAGLTTVSILHRGYSLTPLGLAHVDDVLDEALAVSDIRSRLAVSRPTSSIVPLYAEALGTVDFARATQAEVDAATALIQSDPSKAAQFERQVGEAGGTGLVVTSLRLRELGDEEGLGEAQLALADRLEELEGPLDVRVLSAATINDESSSAIASSMALLMGLALLVIAVLLFVFFRTGSDVALTLVGLAMTVVATMGAQGWLGPDALNLIGPPNQLSSMVPIILIGLVVDYSIQTVGQYRERRDKGMGIRAAAQGSLASVSLPLTLAAGTTIISFLTGLTSPIPANQDFGVIAAVGVGIGLITMLTLVPAARALMDTRRAHKSKTTVTRPLADAIPGAGNAIQKLGTVVARWPVAIIVLAGALSVALGVSAANISTEFDSNDFLPSESDAIEDLEALNEAFGGQTEVATILIEAELTDDRTLRNLLELDQAFVDELSRPTGAAGDISTSAGDLFLEWTTNSGPNDAKFDPELVALAQTIDQGLTVDSVALQATLDRLEELDPAGFDQVVSNNPDGIDRTLIQFPALKGDQDRTAQMVEDIEGLWYGDRTQLTTLSNEITGLEVTTAMTDSQTQSIITTLIAAVVVLMLFFWLTEFRPMLAVIAVVPIGLVLIWVLGTMALLDIPYNVVTALITALSIGIGVDYTIHVIHRFTEELEHRSVTNAVAATLRTTGSALVGSALTTAFGFAVLFFSPLQPFQQFGLVTAITIVYALAASIILTPPLLVVWAAYHSWRTTSPSHH